MVEIIVTKEFENNYKLLPESIKKKAEQKEKIFRINPFNPVLKTEKLYPKEKGYYSFRIDRNYRIIFKFLEKNKVLFLTVGHHNWVYKLLK